MKRLLILIAGILLPLVATMAQGHYTVYECQQGSRIYRSSARAWDDLKKGESVDANTLVNPRKKGAVRILDNDTRRIYSNVKTGRQTVAALISSSSKNANATFGNLNRQLANNVKSSDHRGRYYSTYGATTRGDEELTFTDSLYFAIYHGVRTGTTNDCLKFIAQESGPGSVGFVVVNDSDAPYFITIARGNQENLTFCFDADLYGVDVIPVLPHTTANLTGYVFAAPAEGDQFYLIASPREFWVEPLKNAVRYMNPPEFSADKELVTVVLAK